MVFRSLNTFYPLEQLRSEMDRVLSSFLGDQPEGWSSGDGHGRPTVNVWEENDALMVEMELPGLKHDQLDIAVVGGELSIKIERPDMQQAGVTYHRRERPVGGFTRVLRLATEVDADRVEAQLRDGVLTITLPKAENAKPRKIAVAHAS